MGVKIHQSQRLWVLVLVFVFLNGCATTHYGNFIQNASLDANQIMAIDTAAQIVRLYPPATTHFTLLHSVNDPFGQTLIEKLRLSGFAVQEAAEPILEQSLFVVPQTPSELQAGIRLSYVIDQSDDLYHAKLLIDDTHLSRAFVIRADGIHPAGLWLKWVKKE
jgi:hypothetical protein